MAHVTDDAVDGRATLSRWHAGALAAALFGALLIGLPLAIVVWRSIGGVRVDSDGATLSAAQLGMALGRTFAATGMIALLAVIFGAPVGWTLRRNGSRRLAALVLVPLLMPNYFAYAGWSLLRAPRSTLGDLLADAPAWVSAWTLPVIGVVGLALWSWPLAAVLVSASARRVDQSLLDALDLEGPSALRRLQVLGMLLLPGLAGAFLLVLLLMAGSMVPLDVSQIETYGVLLMRWLNQHPSDIPVWHASWPLLAAAALATLLLVRIGGRSAALVGGDAAPLRRRAGRGVLAWTLVLWGLSVIVPGVLYVLNLRDPPHPATWATIQRWVLWFWREWGEAAGESAGVAARVGVLAAVVGLAVWYAGSGGRASRWTATIVTAGLLSAGLLPGVLVGTAIRRTADMIAPAIGDTTWVVVWAHATRFAFVAAAVGLWLARAESAAERDLRRIDGADSIRGFLHASLRRHAPVLLGAAFAAAILSFHEIEATVAVWPPGVRNLAQEMLDALHFDRIQRLASAATNLLVVGPFAAFLAGWLILGAARDAPEKRTP